MSLPSSLITTVPPQVQFTKDFVQPPGALYLDSEDQLLIRSKGTSISQELGIRLRVLGPDGEIRLFNFHHRPSSLRTTTEELHDLIEGFLLSVGVSSITSDTNHGGTWIEVLLSRGGSVWDTITVPLISSYVSHDYRPSWPSGRLNNAIEGPGWLYHRTGTDPAAGNMINEIVPLNARWKIHSMRFTLQTSAVVGNRRVGLRLDTGAGALPIYYTNYAESIQAQNSLQAYTTAPFGDWAPQGGSVHAINWPREFILLPNHRLVTIVSGLDPGDNFSAPEMLIEEWLSGV